MKKLARTYRLGMRITKDNIFENTLRQTIAEKAKEPKRNQIINLLAKSISAKKYLEIGVRNPANNFDLIDVEIKYSVDPGLAFKLNPVDFKVTSDIFFHQLRQNELSISNDIKFDIIFIDGLHLAEQVDRDISNSLEFLTDDGFIVLHDCNPPSEFHSRETFKFFNGPAGSSWNGTTWKAFLKARTKYYSCCINSDFGVGIISKKARSNFGILEKNENEFYEFNSLEKNRVELLNLITFKTLSTSDWVT